jgi:hypothetical protein
MFMIDSLNRLRCDLFRLLGMQLSGHEPIAFIRSNKKQDSAGEPIDYAASPASDKRFRKMRPRTGYPCGELCAAYWHECRLAQLKIRIKRWNLADAPSIV